MPSELRNGDSALVVVMAGVAVDSRVGTVEQPCDAGNLSSAMTRGHGTDALNECERLSRKCCS